jgi:quinol monooxygenase YgiN
MSGSEVFWVFEVAIKEGEAENLKALIGEMSDRAETSEPATLHYEWMISEDRTSGQVYERYKDSEAALTHLASFNENFAERLMAMADPARMVVYGNASLALKQELAGVDPVYMQRAGGFVR